MPDWIHDTSRIRFPNRRPDFKRLYKVLIRDGEPDVLPFYEFFADMSVSNAYTGITKEVEAHIAFFYQNGYDYAPAFTNFSYTHKAGRMAKATALSLSERNYVNDNHGIIENRADFDAYPWPDISSDVAGSLLRAQELIPDGMKLIHLMPAGILENVMWLMGYIPFSYALADDEQLIWDLFEIVGKNHLKIMKICCETCDMHKVGAAAMGDDMGFATSTMLSPQELRKYVFPWQKKVVELAHHYNLPFILHACGNLETIMDDLIDDVGIDAKHSYEDKIMPVAEAAAKYKSRVSILGGVDMHFLCTTMPETVEPYVRNIIDKCAPGGGYALGTGNSLADYIPFINYEKMLETGMKYGTY